MIEVTTPITTIAVGDTRTGASPRAETPLAPEEFEALFYSTPVASLLGMPDGRVLAVNQAACALLGWSESELRRYTSGPGGDASDLSCAVVLAAGVIADSVRVPVRIRRADGTTVEVDLASRRFRNHRGELRNYVTFLALDRAIPKSETSVDSHLEVERLTRAELRILPLLATHLKIAEIAGHLHTSPNTTKSQVISLYRKLGVNDRSSAVIKARELGLIAHPSMLW
jgi:PAS domain S-box-containing protein